MTLLQPTGGPFEPAFCSSAKCDLTDAREQADALSLRAGAGSQRQSGRTLRMNRKLGRMDRRGASTGS